jgi:hypothetical protein
VSSGRRGRWIDDMYSSAQATAPSPWRQITQGLGLSKDVMRANNIAAQSPMPVESLSTCGAQFDNTDTGERILSYSLQRWNGTPTVNAVTGELAGFDHRGGYTIELWSGSGTRCEMPTEIFGISANATYFGSGWDESARRQTADDAFERIVAAIRRHYRIWPTCVGVSTPHSNIFYFKSNWGRHPDHFAESEYRWPFNDPANHSATGRPRKSTT